jgi:type III restriction enzyme
MENFEVPEPILNGPYQAPRWHWFIQAGIPPEKREGRRRAGYWYRDPKARLADDEHAARGEWREIALVNLIRERIAEWQAQGRPGITRTTRELIDYWTRDGRRQPLFFAQLEAVETIIFLNEARGDFLQGIDIPTDEPSDDRKAEGFTSFRRLGSKMATGSGKSTVMAMLAAWSILNKVAARADGRYSDTVLAVCPNVTIRNRLAEIDPRHGDASLYRTRDLVPQRLMPELNQGRVIVTNWHVFEPQTPQVAGVSGRVSKQGVEVRAPDVLTIGPKTTTVYGKRYITLDDLTRQVNAKQLDVIKEDRDQTGLKSVVVETVRYVESDTALVNRVLGREVGGKQNILVLNDEAHHAYRIVANGGVHDDEDGEDGEDGDNDNDYDRKEATIWVDGLDKVHKLRGINFCVDLSATPYYLRRVRQNQNTVFPWTVSDFGLIDAIESGLVKIPQLAVRDTTGAEVPGYFNIWRWILTKLTPAERGGRRATPKPEAILKYANTPIAMLGGLWDELRRDWATNKDEDRPPVFILVCKNVRIAKVIYEWLAEDKPPTGIPPANLAELKNLPDRVVTIRVDTKVVQETDTEGAKGDETQWMRVTLDTVGKREWPRDTQGRPIYPDGFEELASKLDRPLHPPGRDIRCIVSVGMLTEGWDCNTVTHIVGLRPFMSQLLCEQVVGRGLRRASYDIGPDGRLSEEVAKVFGVPFEVIPFKANAAGARQAAPKRHRIYAIPTKAQYRIAFPRIEGYRQSIRNRVTVDWPNVATLFLDPTQIPPEVEMMATLPSNHGRPSLTGPGRLERVDLNPFREGRRMQELVFTMARDIVRDYVKQPTCEAPAHVLFPQVATIVDRYLRECVIPRHPASRLDVFLSPYYGWVVERLTQAIKPDADSGEAPELPVIERNRPEGSTDDVDTWTSRDVREVIKCHLNLMVADTDKWEQRAADELDKHDSVAAFVKNAGLGFAIPYIDNGQAHDYLPDFIARLTGEAKRFLILEMKGFDRLKAVKRQAAERWVAAINADGRYGAWRYELIEAEHAVAPRLTEIARTWNGA